MKTAVKKILTFFSVAVIFFIFLTYVEQPPQPMVDTVAEFNLCISQCQTSSNKIANYTSYKLRKYYTLQKNIIIKATQIIPF
jgi:hypothetical protein